MSHENLALLQVNKQAADQPAHMHNLISAFVIRYLESIVVSLAPCKISIFQLVYVVEQGGLSLTLLESLKIGFLMLRPISFATHSG